MEFTNVEDYIAYLEKKVGESSKGVFYDMDRTLSETFVNAVKNHFNALPEVTLEVRKCRSCANKWDIILINEKVK